MQSITTNLFVGMLLMNSVEHNEHMAYSLVVETELLYQIRNPLLHSWRLNSHLSNDYWKATSKSSCSLPHSFEYGNMQRTVCDEVYGGFAINLIIKTQCSHQHFCVFDLRSPQASSCGRDCRCYDSTAIKKYLLVWRDELPACAFL